MHKFPNTPRLYLRNLQARFLHSTIPTHSFNHYNSPSNSALYQTFFAECFFDPVVNFDFINFYFTPKIRCKKSDSKGDLLVNVYVVRDIKTLRTASIKQSDSLIDF